MPAVDIRETEKEYLFKAELPDIKKEDVKVELQDGTLRISGERKQEKEEKGTRFHRIERSYGTFTRTFALPSDADAVHIQGELKDGVLTVRVAKKEGVGPKVVSVKVV